MPFHAVTIFKPSFVAAIVAAAITSVSIGSAAAQSSAVGAIVGETNAKTPEVSTADVRRILAEGSAILVGERLCQVSGPGV